MDTADDHFSHLFLRNLQIEIDIDLNDVDYSVSNDAEKDHYVAFTALMTKIPAHQFIVQNMRLIQLLVIITQNRISKQSTWVAVWLLVLVMAMVSRLFSLKPLCSIRRLV